ncbi:MAG: CaiB/BaiF CoA transferase family protein [Pseudomonadota bacterium]
MQGEGEAGPAGRFPGAPTGGALEGLTVLDLTQMLSGPFAAMMLADQGARVIKIEPPEGDAAREIGPWPEGATPQDEGGYGAYFASINRNKLSMTLDLKSQEGREALLRMVRDADVLIENYRLGVMERLGLPYEELRRVNPALVYACVRGFGDLRTGESPYAEWPAYDPISQAMGGIMGITGPVKDGPPTKIGPGVGDIVPAMWAAFGVACACWRAQRTGEGQFVDVAMVDGILALCERLVFQYSATGVAPGPQGNGHPLLHPFGLFRAKDGWISLGIPKDLFWGRFVRRIGHPELESDPRFATNAARMENHQLVTDFVNDWCGGRTREEIKGILGGEVPVAPVYHADDVFADPHFAIRQMLAKVEVPGADAPLTIAGAPVRMTGTPGGVRRRAPLLGEDTEDVLLAFGFSSEEIGRLRGPR